MDGQLEPKVKAQEWFNETYGGNKWHQQEHHKKKQKNFAIRL
jgi:hypothetical protein